MNKKFLIGYIILLIIILLIGGFKYKKHVFQQEKQTVIEKLEDYKRNNFSYPKDLSQIGGNFDKKFYYYTDSLRQSFTLSYSSGIMSVNTNRYNSQTKKWIETFNY